MSNFIGYLITKNGVSFNLKGKPHTISNKDPKYQKVLTLIKNKDEEGLLKLVDISTCISDKFRLQIYNGIVKYTNSKGELEVLPDELNKSLIAMFNQNEDSVKPLLLFWEKLKLNPSFTINKNLFNFITHNNIVIDEAGDLILYKIVKRTNIKDEFVDIYTGKILNKIGSVVSVERKDVDDDISKTCSYGLHVCTWQYLPHYGSAVDGKDAIILCKVDPKDIVAIPSDYNKSKVRVCSYEILSEYTYDKGEIKRILYRDGCCNTSDNDDCDCDNDYYCD